MCTRPNCYSDAEEGCFTYPPDVKMPVLFVHVEEKPDHLPSAPPPYCSLKEYETCAARDHEDGVSSMSD